MTDQNLPCNPLDALIPMIAVTVEKWREEHTPEKVTRKVESLLEDKADEIVAKLLGFNDRWGKWEVDHCNGRGGESAAGDYLRRVHQQAIEEWFNTLLIPKMPKTLSVKLRESLQRDFDRVMQQRMHELVRDYADKEAERLFEELKVSSMLDNYLKTLQLIKEK